MPEIEKIGAYAKGKNITTDDINAVADPVLDAVVFDMTSAVTKGDYDRASELLGQLLKKQEEPIMILGVISKELRRLYTARLALDSGKDKLWLMDLWNMRSDYPARLLLDAARKTTHITDLGHELRRSLGFHVLRIFRGQQKRESLAVQ